MRRVVRFIVFCAATFVASGCASRTGHATATAPAPEPTALAAVPAAPKSRLPAWIVSVSPTGPAKDGSQVRVRFANDIVPVEALEAPDRQAALAHFAIDPPLPGRFVFLTPRLVGFAADVPIPHATRVRVTLTAGLADLSGSRLARDLSWSFTTQPLTFANYSGSDATSTPAPVSAMPRVGIDASDAVRPSSLLDHVRLVDTHDGSTYALRIAPSPSPDPSAAATSDASGADSGSTAVHYDLVPERTLALDRTYRLAIAAGILPAAGNLASAASYAGQVRTYGPLAFEGIADDDGQSRFAGSFPSLSFSNPIDAGTASRAITFSPAPAPGGDALRVDDAGTIEIDADRFLPNTTYEVTIASSLGDTFGQKLATARSARFRTGDLAANFGAPSGLRLFPAGANLALNVASVNLPEGSFRAAYATVKPSDLVDRDLAQFDAIEALLPNKDAWTRRPVERLRNVQSDTAVPLRSLLGGTFGTIAYGVRARTVRTVDANGHPAWTEPEYYGAVQMTDLGVMTQWFPDGGFVRVRRLSDGEPVPNAAVDVYESLTETNGTAPANVAPCATGTTDAAGIWRPRAAAWAACAGTATNASAAPALLTIVRAGADWTYARSTSYENGYANGLSGEGWSAGAPTARGTLVSDRTLYQPGETAKFVGISYFERDGTIARGRSTAFDVVATSPSGEKRHLGSATPDAFGAFSVSLALPAAAAVGAWNIDAAGENGEELTGSFTVAEFKPPNFKVDLTVDERPVAAGTTVASRSQSLYLFGAPVAGGTSHVAVTRARASYAPDGYDAFSFGRSWPYPEEEPSVATDVLQRDVVLDSDGDAAAAIPVATDLPYAMTYTVTTQTTDVSNLAVAATKSFLALPSDVTIGLRTAFVAATGTPIAVDAIALGLDGKPRAGRALELVLQQRVDASATQIVEGSETAHEAVRYVDVATRTVTSGAAPITATFVASKPGDYRIRANFSGAAGDATATDASLWVTGPGTASWIAGDTAGLGVKLDKTTYRPGDVAHVLVQSPYRDAEMYVAVVRHGVIVQRTAIVRGSAPQTTFTVTKDMLPNAAVEAVLVRRGPSLTRGVPSGLASLASTGFAPFDVALDAKYVRVDVLPAHATVGPGGHERLTVRLRARDGTPVRGELTIAVVNDAILQLSGYRFPDLVKSVYADEPISTRLADNYGAVTLRTEKTTLDKGFGYGGGAMAGPPSTRVRTKFLPLAYWNAAVRTDASGDATVDVPLPDDLTTWRVMALALTTDARFGNGEATFVATKPLVTDPILPQFARPGDRFAAGVSVTNVAHARGDVSVRASTTGGAAFVSGSPASAHTTAPGADVSQAYRFDVLASARGDASFTFRTTLGGNADAFTFGVPILTDDVLESAITTGTTGAAASVPVDVAAALHGPLGGLDVTLASTLLAEALEPARMLERSPDPFGTELASRIAIGSDSMVLARRYGETGSVAPLRTSVARDLASLRGLALPDGGFAMWPGAKSEPFTTAFVTVQLLQARDAGFTVAADLAHARAYLRKVLADPYELADLNKDDAENAAEVRLEMLETLGAADEPRTDFLSDVWAYRERFGYYERVEFARFLLRIPAWRARGIALRDELFTQVDLGARHATVDARGEFGESETAGQAQMVQLAIASGMPKEDTDRLLESLLQLRHDGHWGCFCDDAEAMYALVLYAAEDAVPPDFTVDAGLPARVPRDERVAFRGYAETSRTLALPMDALARGSGRVTLRKSGHGTLHYAVALRYRVPDESPGIYQGLRIDRIVRSPGDPRALATFGLGLPIAPTDLAAARVFDVEDRIVTDHPVENVLVTDPLPAGFEAVNQTFRTSAPAPGETDDALSLNYQSIYKNRVISFVEHLDPGAYAIHYLVRSVTPGTFAWPGAIVRLQYEPEEFGRTAGTQVVVTP